MEIPPGSSFLLRWRAVPVCFAFTSSFIFFFQFYALFIHFQNRGAPDGTQKRQPDSLADEPVPQDVGGSIRDPTILRQVMS